MSSFRAPTVIAADLGIGIAITPAQATPTGDGFANSVAVKAIEPRQDATRAPAHQAQPKKGSLPHWRSSGVGPTAEMTRQPRTTRSKASVALKDEGDEHVFEMAHCGSFRRGGFSNIGRGWRRVGATA
jgi:hypothetical protein